MIKDNIDFFPNQESPKPSEKWKNMSRDERIKSIQDMIVKNNFDALEAFNAFDHGEILLKVIKDLPVNNRGNYLLDFEILLKNKIDKALYVMIEPLGDKNSLRKLRGINIVKGYEG